MKLFFKKIAPYFLIVLFAGCNNNSPKPVAENFLSAMSKMDFDKAKQYGTEDTGKLLDMMSGFAKMMPDSAKHSEMKFAILGEKIDGDKATVTYTEEGKQGEQSVPLMKVDGKWKVAMSKEGMNAAEGGSNDAGEPDTANSSENIPLDSLRK